MSWLRWMPAAGCAGVIYMFSVVPYAAGSAGSSMVLPSVLQHAVAYAVLTGLIYYAHRFSPEKRGSSILFAVLFGVGIEVNQFFLPSRFFGLVDIAANTVGAMIVFLHSSPVQNRAVSLLPRANRN